MEAAAAPSRWDEGNSKRKFYYPPDIRIMIIHNPADAEFKHESYVLNLETGEISKTGGGYKLAFASDGGIDGNFAYGQINVSNDKTP